MSAKAATLAPPAEAPMPPILEALTKSAARVRRRAARLHKKYTDDGNTDAAILEALTLLKHLRQSHIEAAIWAHKVLVREAIHALREFGLTNMWDDDSSLINDVHEFLQVHGWVRTEGGRWMRDDEAGVLFRARMAAANSRGERPAIVG